MAWESEMVIILRALINDLDPATQKYTDDRLQVLLTVAARQVLAVTNFDNAYTVSVSAVTISPDPAGGNSTDDSFVNLVCLKAACITDRGEARTAATQAIAVRDGASSVDLTGAMKGKLELLKNGGWCSAFEDAWLEYKIGAVHVAGAAVMTPFRAYINGNIAWDFQINQYRPYNDGYAPEPF